MPADYRSGCVLSDGAYLFEGVGQTQQPWLAPGQPHEREPDRQPAHASGRDRERRVAADRAGRRGAEAVVVAEYVVGQPGGVAGDDDHGVEAMGGEGAVEACPGQRSGLVASRPPLRVSPALRLISGDEDLLT